MIRHIERLFGCELRYAEYILAAQAALWGVWILPASRIGLGGLMIAVGGLLWVALRNEWRPLRRRMCFSLFVLWLLVAIASLIADPRSSTFPLHIGYAGLCLFAYLRLSGANI